MNIERKCLAFSLFFSFWFSRISLFLSFLSKIIILEYNISPKTYLYLLVQTTQTKNRNATHFSSFTHYKCQSSCNHLIQSECSKNLTKIVMLLHIQHDYTNQIVSFVSLKQYQWTVQNRQHIFHIKL